MPEVNDVQSRVNRTEVHSIVMPGSEVEIHQALEQAMLLDVPVSIAGGRHSMGGQQFGSGTMLLDMKQYNAVIEFDRINGLIEVESGIMWPQLIQYLHENQDGEGTTWAVRQKQTGIDKVSIGGSLSSNIHGRGLKFPPFISDIESFKIINHAGETFACSRTENAELFSLAIGGYGLFGVVTHVTLRLVPRQVVKRMVEVIAVRNLLPRIDAAMEEGFIYGDCQYSIDLEGDEEFHPGVFSCYKPVADDTPVSEERKQMAGSDWAALYRLARTDKGKAFRQYEQFYLGTSGQVYWSDAHQLSNGLRRLQRGGGIKARDGDDHRDLRPGRFTDSAHGRCPPGFREASRRHDLWDDPVHRARYRELPALGHGTSRLHRVQPAHHAYTGRT